MQGAISGSEPVVLRINETENCHSGYVDCPGHADYVRQKGAAQMDDAILLFHLQIVL